MTMRVRDRYFGWLKYGAKGQRLGERGEELGYCPSPPGEIGKLNKVGTRGIGAEFIYKLA